MSKKELTKEKELSYFDFKNQILSDYKIIVLSRETSIPGRREVLTGKAKFGIFGDGKELPQIVLSHFFNGAWIIFVSKKSITSSIPCIISFKAIGSVSCLLFSKLCRISTLALYNASVSLRNARVAEFNNRL